MNKTYKLYALSGVVGYLLLLIIAFGMAPIPSTDTHVLSSDTTAQTQKQQTETEQEKMQQQQQSHQDSQIVTPKEDVTQPHDKISSEFVEPQAQIPDPTETSQKTEFTEPSSQKLDVKDELPLPQAKLDSTPGIVHPLNIETFDLMKQSSDVWIVKFFRPTCGYCTAFAPDYITLAQTYSANDNLAFGEVNCADYMGLYFY
eukprot:MONOS_7174.1-p1 / transcript=MONOS_7174.1 / gene=MONOS_7174 / organism=Monocercomonoides_exilis_PA203 / gene_product=Protein disulfide-isomerase / transcript_product=Protein disulfide-isomerase / location=Mono_scaffold00239:46750-47462(-) / protein_length=201 / sequence_SO=supercontig / SO=protein_coding / is_pseudo=false